MRVFALVLLLPGLAFGQIYKCPKAGGGFDFTDRPCAGAAESPSNAISVDARPSPDVERAKSAKEAQDAKDREVEHQRYVEVPATELQAVGLMASSDPQKQALGKELAVQVQRQKKALDDYIRARKAQKETTQRYDDAIRRLQQ